VATSEVIGMAAVAAAMASSSGDRIVMFLSLFSTKIGSSAPSLADDRGELEDGDEREVELR
jgi:hypothetical protein